MRRILMIAPSLIAAPAAAPAQTQTAMNRQAGDEWQAADAAMTAQWQRTHAAMKRRDAGTTRGGFGHAAATLASQRAWLAFRDRQCIVEGAEYAGGSMQPMVQRQCLARLTRERTVQLKDMMWQRGR